MNDRTCYVGTVSGVKFNVEVPDSKLFNEDDCIHNLSKLRRWRGSLKNDTNPVTNTYYSVLDHSMLVAHLVKLRTDSQELILQGLYHDFTEAYLTDMPSPVKRFCSDYRDIESNVATVISEAISSDPKFKGLNVELDKLATIVKECDFMALWIEVMCLGNIALASSFVYSIEENPWAYNLTTKAHRLYLDDKSIRELVFDLRSLTIDQTRARFNKTVEEVTS